MLQEECFAVHGHLLVTPPMYLHMASVAASSVPRSEAIWQAHAEWESAMTVLSLELVAA